MGSRWTGDIGTMDVACSFARSLSHEEEEEEEGDDWQEDEEGAWEFEEGYSDDN